MSIKADGDGVASVKLYELGDLSVEKYDRAKLLLEEFDIELRNKEICEGSCNVKILCYGALKSRICMRLKL